MKSERDLVEQLRERIVRALHIGELHTGDRLPSIRELARETGTDARIVARAYRTLEEDGLVEVRGRSGVYAAEQEHLGGELLSETARWLAGVVVEAWKRKIGLSDLPELIRRSTAPVRLRCAVVECSEDSLLALCAELGRGFALDCRPVFGETLPVHAPGEPVEAERLPAELRDADLVVTTPFQAGRVRGVAAALGLPLVVVTANPEIGPTLERRLREGRVNAVIADARFTERMRSTYGGAYGDRMRIVLADDSPAIAALDLSEPVLLTEAARRRLGELGPMDLVPHSPCISTQSARELTELLIRLHAEGRRADPAVAVDG
jgi:DNA-binding transcriptional regulator YhcF (GntR family)